MERDVQEQVGSLEERGSAPQQSELQAGTLEYRYFGSSQVSKSFLE